MGVHAAKRLPGFSYIGQCEYSVTCCTFKRQRLFTTPAIVDAVCTQLLQIAARQRFEIPAYCFMPDHVHVLAAATADDSDLRHFVSRWKQQTGYSHRRRENTTLWQGGFYEHVLRAEEDRAAVIRYLIENPLRAGLVQNVFQHPYWGSGMCSREELIEGLYDAPARVRGG